MKIIYSIVTITKDVILSVAWLVNEAVETEDDELRMPDHVYLDDDLSFTTQNLQ